MKKINELYEKMELETTESFKLNLSIKNKLTIYIVN